MLGRYGSSPTQHLGVATAMDCHDLFLCIHCHHLRAALEEGLVPGQRLPARDLHLRRVLHCRNRVRALRGARGGVLGWRGVGRDARRLPRPHRPRLLLRRRLLLHGHVPARWAAGLCALRHHERHLRLPSRLGLRLLRRAALLRLHHLRHVHDHEPHGHRRLHPRLRGAVPGPHQPLPHDPRAHLRRPSLMSPPPPQSRGVESYLNRYTM
mmetsp:Transcript_18204/g.50217  ORF Transcript_18204/g.50217 Transcript_18204/m.50217 type:complete len:210 (+) Transcript_18204:188-817(+)